MRSPSELLRSDDFRVLMMGSNLPEPLALAGAPHPRRSAPSAASAVAAGRRAAGPHALPQVGLGRVHSQGGRRVYVIGSSRLRSACWTSWPTSPVSLTSSDGTARSFRSRSSATSWACPTKTGGGSWNSVSSPRRAWTSDCRGGSTAACSEGIAGFNVWLADHLRQLRRAPGDDLMSQLIQTAESGSAETLSQRNRTSGDRRAGVGRRVRDHGEPVGQRDSHAAGHARAPATRCASVPSCGPMPSKRSCGWTRRYSSPRGWRSKMSRWRAGRSNVASWWWSIWQPPTGIRSVFPDPHRFDIERPNAGRHLAFSGGRHFCLGAALARAEGEVGLRTFFDRFPDVRAAGTGSRRDTRVLRGWSALPVALGRARSMAPRRLQGIIAARGSGRTSPTVSARHRPLRRRCSGGRCR